MDRTRTIESSTESDRGLGEVNIRTWDNSTARFGLRQPQDQGNCEQLRDTWIEAELKQIRRDRINGRQKALQWIHVSGQGNDLDICKVRLEQMLPISCQHSIDTP